MLANNLVTGGERNQRLKRASHGDRHAVSNIERNGVMQ
jgi:hypothetical protein